MMPISSASEKPLQHRAAEEQQRHHHDRGDDLGHDGARQRLVDRLVEHHVGRRAPVGLEALADTIEHHHRVVERVADDREDRRDHRQVERHLRQGEETDHQDRVMQHREDRAEGQPPGMEAEGDVEEDQQQGEEQRPDGAGLAARSPPAARRRRAAAPARRRRRAFSAASSRARISVAVCLGSGGRRMEMSREEPKICTCGSWKPAPVSSRAHLIDVDRAREVDLRAHAAGEVDGRDSGRG